MKPTASTLLPAGKIAKTIVCLIAGFVFPTSMMSQTTEIFSRYFHDRTLRVEYYRDGCGNGSTVTLRDLAAKYGTWAGSQHSLLDTFAPGTRRVAVYDCSQGKTGILLYSHNYNTLFDEYRYTWTGLDCVARFEESVLIPFPKKSIEIHIQERTPGKNNDYLHDSEGWRDEATWRFDPERQGCKTAKGIMPIPVHYSGDPHEAIDIVFVMQGYKKRDTTKRRNDAEMLYNAIVNTPPFDKFEDKINLWRVDLKPKDTITTFNTFGIARYTSVTRQHDLHRLLDATPYDYAIVVINDTTYGGGGIYNFCAICTMNPRAKMVLPHEMGHLVGGLEDEYVEEDNPMQALCDDGEPLAPNVTTFRHFERKWKSIVARPLSIPTPVNCELSSSVNGPIGLFEGAVYHLENFYRPCQNCMMRCFAPFCPVCSGHLTKVLQSVVAPLE